MHDEMSVSVYIYTYREMSIYVIIHDIKVGNLP